MKKILLDTHVLIWLAVGSGIGKNSILDIKNADIVFVSTLSILELRVKKAAGKLSNAEAIVETIPEMGLEILDFAEQHSSNYELFNKRNRDPFDNALVSVAVSEGLRFMTADSSLLNHTTPKLVTIDARK